MFQLDPIRAVPLVISALLEYMYLCYERIQLSKTKIHKYSVYFETSVSLFFLPIFLVTDLLQKNPPSHQFFWPYVFVDVTLKFARTAFTHYLRDEFVEDPLFDRQSSWSRSVSEGSFMDCVTSFM